MGRLKDFADLNVGKKPPVKAQPNDNNVGGIFSTKLVAILQKIREKWRNS